jgi:hypothetical protein
MAIRNTVAIRPIPGTYCGKVMGAKRTSETCCKLIKNAS